MSSQCLCQFKPSQKRLTHLKYDWSTSVRWSSHQCYSLVMVTKLTADCSHCRYSDWRIETSQSSVTVRSRNTKLNFTLSIKHQIYWSDNNVTLRNIHFIKVLHFSSLGPTLSDDSLKQSYVTEAPACLHACLYICISACLYLCMSACLQVFRPAGLYDSSPLLSRPGSRQSNKLPAPQSSSWISLHCPVVMYWIFVLILNICAKPCSTAAQFQAHRGLSKTSKIFASQCLSLRGHKRLFVQLKWMIVIL